MQTLRLVLDIIGLLTITTIVVFCAWEAAIRVLSRFQRRRIRRELERQRETGAARNGGWRIW